VPPLSSGGIRCAFVRSRSEGHCWCLSLCAG
jgi:hypothetical protein